MIMEVEMDGALITGVLVAFVLGLRMGWNRDLSEVDQPLFLRLRWTRLAVC